MVKYKYRGWHNVMVGRVQRDVRFFDCPVLDRGDLRSRAGAGLGSLRLRQAGGRVAGDHVLEAVNI